MSRTNALVLWSGAAARAAHAQSPRTRATRSSRSQPDDGRLDEIEADPAAPSCSPAGEVFSAGADLRSWREARHGDRGAEAGCGHTHATSPSRSIAGQRARARRWIRRSCCPATWSWRPTARSSGIPETQRSLMAAAGFDPFAEAASLAIALELRMTGGRSARRARARSSGRQLVCPREIARRGLRRWRALRELARRGAPVAQPCGKRRMSEADGWKRTNEASCSTCLRAATRSRRDRCREAQPVWKSS